MNVIYMLEWAIGAYSLYEILKNQKHVDTFVQHSLQAQAGYAAK